MGSSSLPPRLFRPQPWTGCGAGQHDGEVDLMDESGRIFISYRRDETEFAAGWLFDRLIEHLGQGQVFKDVDSIELGDDFVEVITAAVARCDVLLVLIGDRWLTIAGEGGRRLDDPDDFVRLEIEAALTRKVRVIPVLVKGAQMPRVADLPPSMAKLARRQALELSPARFNFDTNRLLKVLEKTLTEVRIAHEDEVVEAAHREAAQVLEGVLADRKAAQADPATSERAASTQATSKRLWHAMALVNKGNGLREKGRSTEAIRVFDDVVARFGDDTHPPVREQVAMALVFKGFELDEQDRPEEEIRVYDEVVARFGEDTHPLVRVQVAMALVNKGLELGVEDRSAEAIRVCDEVVARFGEDGDPPVRAQVARALTNKGLELGDQGRSAEAIRVYDEAVARFGEDIDPRVLQHVDAALASKKIELGEHD